MKTFSINNTVIKARDIDFNMICDFEAEGVSMDQIQNKPLSVMRLYIAFCADTTPEKVGEMIGMHLAKGGSIEEVFKIFSDAVNDSTFFQSITKKAEETAPENQEEDTKKDVKAKA